MDLTELKRSINMCKESISCAAQDLTKLTGRIYDKSIDLQRHFLNNSRDNLINNQRFTAKRKFGFDNENSAVTIKRTRIDKELPSLNSVVKMTKGRTRNDAICDLKINENPKDKERCKRLFGHLMGTLNSIKKESEKSHNDPQQITRLKIEKKVEEDHKLINETIKREQNELLRAKKERQFDLKNLNQRYRAAEAFERWRIEKEKMKGFIRTCKSPFIFYKPKIINDESQLRIDKTALDIDLMIENRRTKLELEIEKAVKRHLETSGNKYSGEIIKKVDRLELEEGEEEGNRKGFGERKNGGKVKKSSVEGSFASEDYDDMIEEIEITMCDEPVVQTHEEEVIVKEEEKSVEEEAEEERLVERIKEELDIDVPMEVAQD